jgi:DNA-binding PadR family transcriptional regulator
MRLSDRGLLESKWEPSEHEGRPPRKLYRLNAEGAAYAIEYVERESLSPARLSPGRA